MLPRKQFGLRPKVVNIRRELGRLAAKRATADLSTPGGKILHAICSTRIAELHAQMDAPESARTRKAWAGR